MGYCNVLAPPRPPPCGAGILIWKYCKPASRVMVQVMVVEQQEGQGPGSRAKFRVESWRRSIRPNNARRSSVLNKVGRITFFVSQSRAS